MSVLDILECPICKQASRIWKLNGDILDAGNVKRITNGSVVCPNEHSWNVVEEVLRFDKPEANEPMQFLDHPRTGFPSTVGEQERLEFLDQYQGIVENLTFEENETVVVNGDPILFMKYLKKPSSNIIIVHEDEGILRQMQEIAVRKRIYDQMAFIRSDHVGYLGRFLQVHLLKPSSNEGLNILLTKDEIGEVRWEGAKTDLRVVQL